MLQRRTENDLGVTVIAFVETANEFLCRMIY
jgi:hypothetical protein